MHDPDKLRLFEILATEHEPMLMAYILSLVSDPVRRRTSPSKPS